jgi:hypothetical protein
MKPPFSIEQFFKVFEHYNESLFPMQILILIVGLLSVFLLHTKYPAKNRLIGGILAVLWLWTGILYHIAFFSSINSAAFAFGGLFILQGGLILYETFIKKRLDFHFKSRMMDYIGYLFVLFGLIIYPVISYSLEHSLVKTIALGLPCPTTIFTLGIFILTDKKFPIYILIIPSVWALIGLGAAINFGVYQDFIMIIAAVVADIYLIMRR